MNKRIIGTLTALATIAYGYSLAYGGPPPGARICYVMTNLNW